VKNWRVIIVLVAIVLALVAVYPNPTVKGITIRSVALNSSASLAGIESPKPTSTPMSKERVISINNIIVNDVSDYYNFVSTLEPNRSVQIKTNDKIYSLITIPLLEITVLNETEFITVEEVIEINETIDGNLTLVNKTINKTILVNKTTSKVIGTEDIGLSVYNAPTTNIRKGLDLQGGTRVLLEPEEILDKEGLDILIENMKYRLNIYGLSDVLVREASDLSGNQYILVEIAGANEEEVKELMAKQGKFESKIGNETVFMGGKDITHVCRTADCSGIDPSQGCGQSGSDWVCRFRFSISLTPEAAQKQADLTAQLDVISENNQDYLSEKLSLYLDDSLVDELNIGSDLKGRAVTDIQISGTGAGKTQQEAIFNSLENMKRLQTILITGSLPVKLNIVKTDNISPALGEEFIKSAILIGLLAILVIFIVVYARYRKLKIAVPLILTSLIEVVLLLGVASVIGWNLDLAAIAGIIIAVGTGIDHQIVITDETLRGESSSDWKKRIKNAFFIIIGAFLTTVFALFPLLSAGAGLLKGFALTTMIGAVIGVFIARPAYAAVIEILLKE
jgi:preprotein translocase subunit SecD